MEQEVRLPRQSKKERWILENDGKSSLKLNIKRNTEKYSSYAIFVYVITNIECMPY